MASSHTVSTEGAKRGLAEGAMESAEVAVAPSAPAWLRA